MKRLTCILLGLVIVTAGACGGTDAEVSPTALPMVDETVEPQATATVVPQAEAASPRKEAPTIMPETVVAATPPVDDAQVIFIATLDAATADSEWNQVVADDPDRLIAIGQWVCAEIVDGEEVLAIADNVLANLSEANGLTEATAQQQAMAGSVVGAAVGAFCPDYRDAIS